MGFKEEVYERGYDFQNVEQPFIKIRKRDIRDLSDIVIIFDKETETITGGLITLKPIQTLDDMSHQYSLFRVLSKDIRYFSSKTKYDII